MTKCEMIREFSNECHSMADIEKRAKKVKKERVEKIWAVYKKDEAEGTEDMRKVKEFCWAVL